jgi:hypothetical protein
MMDYYPPNIFIVWNLAPLHRLATNPKDAGNAGEFVEWVINEWWTEDDNEPKNIKIFDFWDMRQKQIRIRTALR